MNAHTNNSSDPYHVELPLYNDFTNKQRVPSASHETTYEHVFDKGLWGPITTIKVCWKIDILIIKNITFNLSSIFAFLNWRLNALTGVPRVPGFSVRNVMWFTCHLIRKWLVSLQCYFVTPRRWFTSYRRHVNVSACI